MNHADPKAEFDLLHVLFDEACTLGAKHGARILDRIDLRPGDFSVPKHQKLFGAIVTLIRAGKTPDEAQLRRAVPELNGEVEAFCAPYNRILSPTQTEGLADITKDLSRKRSLKAALFAASAMIDQGACVADAVLRLQSGVNALPQAGATWMEPRESVADMSRYLNEIQDGKVSPFLATGIHKLDEKIGGLQPSLNVIAARGGVGKTAMLSTILRNASMRGQNTLTFSLEDGHRGIRIRHYAKESGLSLSRLRRPNWGAEEVIAVGRAANSVEHWPGRSLIDQSEGLTGAEVLHRARLAIVLEKVELVAVDNITAMSWPRNQRSDLDVQDFLRQARDLAGEFHVPVLVLSHVKSSIAEDKMPSLEDCSESGGFGKLARVGIGLARVKGDGVIAVAITKGTFVGPAGQTFEVDFDGPSGMLANRNEDRPEPEQEVLL